MKNILNIEHKIIYGIASAFFRTPLYLLNNKNLFHTAF